MSWKRGSLSKAKRCGGCNPCTLRTNIDKEMLKILTRYQSAAAVPVWESPEPVKLDFEAIPACSNVAMT
jgi:hypothetical protein